MEFQALIGAEDRLSDFGTSAIFHEKQQKMADRHCRGIYTVPEDAAGKGYMGKRDLAGKDFFADRQRFADLLNAVLYYGKKVIRPEELEQLTGTYPSFSGKGEMSRDIFMKDQKRNVCYSLELETESDYSMPERVMAYDACELEQQIREIRKGHREEEQQSRENDKDRKEGERTEKLSYREKKSRMKETDFLLPVITVVLYLGTGHWEGRRKLSELYRISEETEKLVGEMLPDYGFLLPEADYINAEAFETDLREFFQAMQCRSDKIKLRELLRSERFRQLKEETAWTIAVHLDRKRLGTRIERRELGMCIALDELLADERDEGRTEGRTEERNSIIRNMIQQGLDEEFICRLIGCSRQEYASAAEN